MVMQWLTRDWLGWGSEPTSEQVAERLAEYRAHLRTVLPRLPTALKALADEPSDGRHDSLHDARIEAWATNPPDVFSLQVVSGDLAHGYQRLRIEYRGAELFGASHDDVAVWFDDERTEMICQEIDADSERRFEHRHLLWPDGEFGIRFRANSTGPRNSV